MHMILHGAGSRRSQSSLASAIGRRVDEDHMVQGVYDRIKARLLARAIAPGQLLQIGVLAEELGVSSTPVREALMRLAAERLIVLVPKKGFFTKIPAEEELRGLYCVTESILESALRFDARAAVQEVGVAEASPPADTGRDLCSQLVRRTAELFVRVAARPGIGEYVDIVRNANDRLHQARLIECDVIGRGEEELMELEALYASGRLGELAAALRSYHAVRLQWLPSICKELLFRPFASVQR
jgi:DNA-binding GntR family transcriptional regulator